MVVIIGRLRELALTEAEVMLQQLEACHVFSQGFCPWITGPWQWWMAQAPWRVVDNDLHLHTGFLVAAAVTLAFHACLCGLS